MKFLRFLKPEKQEFLVLDFGSSSVKGLIFEKGKGKNIIKKYSYEDLEKFGVFNGREFELEAIKKAAKKVIDDLGMGKEILQAPVLLGASPKILKGKIVEVSLKRKNRQEKIEKEEERRIYQTVLREAEKRVFQDFSKESGIIPQDLKILKKEILTEEISGYPISSLLGKEGENLSFKILIIFGLREYLKTLEKIKSFLGFEELGFFHQVEGLVSLAAEREDMAGIFLDIGQEFSQIFSIKKGVEWMAEFPFGGDIFTREICQKLGLTEKEGEDLKRRLSQNQLSPELTQRIENLITETSEFWFSKLKEKLREKAKSYPPLLNNFYLFGGGSWLPGIKKVLSQGNFEDLPLAQPQKVNFLKIEDLPLQLQIPISSESQALPSILLTFCKYAKENY